MQALGAAGGSGIYMVSTEGGKLAWSAAKNAYIGGMTTASGELAQASLRPVVFNPTTICIAVTMVAAIVKLDEISNNVKEVIDTFKRKDSANIKTAIRRLQEIKDNYRENSENENLLQLDMIDIRNSLREMMKLQEEYKDKLLVLIKDESLKISNEDQFNDIREAYNYYEWATYLIGICKFMLVGYERKLDNEHLQKVREEIKKYCDEIQDLYRKSCDFIEKRYGNSIVGGISQISDSIINGVTSIPLPIAIPNVFGIVSGDKLKELRDGEKEKEMKKIDSINRPQLESVIDKIDMIDKLYNVQFKIVVDKEAVYIER